MMNKLSISRVSAALAVLSSTTYFICFVWNAVAHSPFSDTAFAAAFPGFSWSLIGFATGLGWSILYSGYVGVVFVVAYNFCCRVIPTPHSEGQRSG
ncbi:hypothetical protein GCM10010533_28440 [Mycolicibacterium pallens]